MKYILYLSALAAGAIATAAIAPKADAVGGDLYETDFTSGMISIQRRRTRTTFASGLSGPEGMAFDRNRNFLRYRHRDRKNF